MTARQTSATGDRPDEPAEFFPADPPARMTMQTPLPGTVLISVGCVALVAPPGSG